MLALFGPLALIQSSWQLAPTLAPLVRHVIISYCYYATTPALPCLLAFIATISSTSDAIPTHIDDTSYNKPSA
jgi:hypothetical protein